MSIKSVFIYQEQVCD